MTYFLSGVLLLAYTMYIYTFKAWLVNILVEDYIKFVPCVYMCTVISLTLDLSVILFQAIIVSSRGPSL